MKKINTSPFKRFIGIWKTTGQVSIDNNTLKLTGIDNYEFVLDGNYMLHKANVKMGSERSETLEIFELGPSDEKAKMKYFNSKGEKGVMTSSLTNNDFKIDGKGIKFIGTINSDNTQIIGKWYLRTEKKDWREFIKLRLEKQN